MKKYMPNTEDRKVLVNRIGELAGEKMSYKGMPSCAYEGNGFTVEKTGSLIVGEDADEEILRTLLNEGLILPDETEGEETAEEATETETESTAVEEEETNQEIDSLTISLPMEGHTPDSLRNLVNMIYSRGPLLSKATGGEFKAGAELAQTVNEGEALPDTEAFRNFIENLLAAHGELKGIIFEEERITFTGFPMTEDPKKLAAFQQIACAMNKTAKDQKRIQAKEIVTESEKYTFRNWLVRLGMGGAEFKEARQILLDPLGGHTAFRNKAEEEKWKANQKAKRQAAKAETTGQTTGNEAAGVEENAEESAMETEE